MIKYQYLQKGGFSMNKLFFGFLLIFINFNLTINGHTINIFPEWAGYCLMYSGLNDLANEGEHFALARPWCLAMVVYSGVLWLVEIFFGSVKLGIIGTILSVVATLVSIYVSYLILQGIAEIERNRGVDLGQPALMQIWKVFVICILISSVLLFMPALAVVSAIVAFVAVIIFLVRFNRTRKAYNALV